MNIQKNAFSIEEIKSIFREKGEAIADTVFKLLKCFNIVQLCRKSGIVKLKGYTVDEILTILFLLPFMLINTVRGFITGNYQLTHS